MFVLEPRYYTIKQVALLLDMTPQAVTKSIRLHKSIHGVPFNPRTRKGSAIRIPRDVYILIKQQL